MREREKIKRKGESKKSVGGGREEGSDSPSTVSRFCDRTACLSLLPINTYHSMINLSGRK